MTRKQRIKRIGAILSEGIWLLSAEQETDVGPFVIFRIVERRRVAH